LRERRVRDSLAGFERAAQVIGYRPPCLMAEGLRRTWTWFAERDAPSRAYL
jgi:hypothetical protein